MKRSRLLDFIPAASLALLAVCTPLLALAEPVDGPQAAVIFPPGWDGADVMRAAARANVAVVRFGALDNIGIVEIRDDTDLRRLRAAGAWFTLHPQALGGCLLGSELAAGPLAPPRTGVRSS